METKEYIITGDSTAEERAEALARLVNAGSETLHFDSIQTMSLTDEVQTIRTFSVMGATVTVSDDQFVEFVEEYLRERATVLDNRLATAKADAHTAMSIQAQMWEDAGYEYPFNVE